MPHIPDRQPTLSEINGLVHPREDTTAVRILRTDATCGEIEQAMAWVQDQDEPSKAGHGLGGRAAAVYEILTAEEELPDDET